MSTPRQSNTRRIVERVRQGTYEVKPGLVADALLKRFTLDRAEAMSALAEPEDLWRPRLRAIISVAPASPGFSVPVTPTEHPAEAVRAA